MRRLNGRVYRAPLDHTGTTEGRKWAMHMVMTGETRDAGKALEIGPVREGIAGSAPREWIRTPVQRLSNSPRVRVKIVKNSFDTAAESGFAELLALESEDPVACDSGAEIRATLPAFIHARKRR